MSDFQSETAPEAKNVADDLSMLKQDVASLIKQMKDMAMREGSRRGR
jgi:hydrogenase maturation factor